MSIAEYLHEGEIALGSSMPRLASKKAFLLVPAFDDQLEPSCSLLRKEHDWEVTFRIKISNSQVLSLNQIEAALHLKGKPRQLLWLLTRLAGKPTQSKRQTALDICPMGSKKRLASQGYGKLSPLCPEGRCIMLSSVPYMMEHWLRTQFPLPSLKQEGCASMND